MADNEKRRGYILFFGLRNGMNIGMLTEEDVKFDGTWLHIKTTEGEDVSIRNDDVVYTRRREVDVPSDDEVADFLKSLANVATKLPSNGPSDAPAGLGGHYL